MAMERTEVEFAGVVRDVLRFRGSAEGAGVLTIMDASGRREKAVGVVEGIRQGDYVEIVGYEAEHPTYGKQIRAQKVTTSYPTTKKMFAEWLQRHFMAPFANTNALVDEWYSEFATLGVATSPAAVPVKGTGDFELLRLWAMIVEGNPGVQQHFAKHGLSAEYVDVRQFILRKHTVDTLMSMGLDTKEAHGLFLVRGARAATELRDDPYVVFYYLDNVPFTKIDKIYLAQPGHKKVDDRRVKALCLNVLRSCTDEGHTAMYYDDFIAMLEETYPELSATKLMSNFDALIPEFVVLYGSPTMVQLAPYARFEAGIAEFVIHGKVLTLPPELENNDDSEDETGH